MKFADLVKKDTKELCEICAQLKKEQLNLRILSKTGQEVKSSAMRDCRKNVARVKTRLRQLKGN